MVPLWYVSEISYLLKFLTVTQGNHGMVIVTQIPNLNLLHHRLQISIQQSVKKIPS